MSSSTMALAPRPDYNWNCRHAFRSGNRTADWQGRQTTASCFCLCGQPAADPTPCAYMCIHNTSLYLNTLTSTFSRPSIFSSSDRRSLMRWRTACGVQTHLYPSFLKGQHPTDEHFAHKSQMREPPASLATSAKVDMRRPSLRLKQAAPDLATEQCYHIGRAFWK